jgi:catechol 2,3-dioxygenase-like lactoylglutathione lyase family enzyme
MQIDHVAIPVTDIAAARAFYEQALAPLGVQVVAERPSAVVFGGGQGQGMVGLRQGSEYRGAGDRLPRDHDGGASPPNTTLPPKPSPELVGALRRDANTWASVFAVRGCNNKYMGEPICKRWPGVGRVSEVVADATVEDIERQGTEQVGPPAGSIYLAAVTFSNSVVVVFGGGRPEAVPPAASCPGAGSGCVWKVELVNPRFIQAARASATTG